MKSILQLRYNGREEAGRRMLLKMQPHVAGMIGLEGNIYQEIESAEEGGEVFKLKILKPLYAKSIAGILCDHGFQEKEDMR